MFTKQWILAFTLILTAGGIANAQPLAKSNLDYYFSHGIATLIEELGSSSYAKRETAYKTIESFGPMALDQLRRFRSTGNTEAKRRVEELIRRAEDRQIAQQILAPKEVTLKWKAATVQEAISDLAVKSGYPIQFQGDATRFADKKVTLEGRTSYWQALDKLCEQAGLMERIDVSPSTDPYLRDGSPYPSQSPHGPMVLVNRGSERSIVSYTGAVKTEMRVSRDKDTNDVNVVFVTSAEPRLGPQSLLGIVLIGKCVDEQCKKLTVLDGPSKRKLSPGEEAVHQAELERIAAFGAADPGSGLYRRTAQIHIKNGDALTRIRDLAGKLTMQVDLQNVTLARVDKVLDAAGKSVDGVNGGRMTVQSIKKLSDGHFEAKVSLENIIPHPFGANVIGKGGVVIRGNVIINGGGGMVIGPNGVRITSNGTGSAKDVPDLLDAKGQKFKKAVFDDNFHLTNGSSSRVASIAFHANAGQTEPSELVLFGTRTYTIAVPFRFENVPLP